MNPSFNDFELQEILGKGAFGKVYLAKHIRTKQLRAIKVVSLDVKNWDEVPELIREIQFLAQCSHPNITQYYYSFIHETAIWMVTEYVQVGSLRQLVPLDVRH